MPSHVGMLDGVEVESYVVLSTAHMTESDSQNLKQLCTYIEEGLATPPEGIVHIQASDYGWRIKHASDAGDDELIERSMQDLRGRQFSEAFCAIIRSAILSTHTGVVFDRDGEVYDHIEHFDW